MCTMLQERHLSQLTRTQWKHKAIIQVEAIKSRHLTLVLMKLNVPTSERSNNSSIRFSRT